MDVPKETRWVGAEVLDGKRAIQRARKREGPNARARSESHTTRSGEAVSICSPHPCLLGFLTKKFIRKLRLVSGMRKLGHKVVQ